MVKKELVTIGWREWVSLPTFSNKKIKVKVDTGARTSALHVTNLRIVRVGQARYARFIIHPNQDSSKPAIECRSRLVEKRRVKSSTGHSTVRPVIKVPIKMGDYIWESEITLINRDLMGFRMLLGREALRFRFLVNSGKSYMIGKSSKLRGKV